MPDDREVKIRITADTSGLSQALTGAGDVSKTTADVQRTLASSADRVSSSYVRLKSSLDPAFAASMKLVAALQTTNAALHADVIGSEEYAATMGQISAALGTSSVELGRNAAAFRALQAIKERSLALEEAQAAAAEAATNSQVSALGKLMAQYRALEAIKVRSLALEATQAAGTEESTTVQTASLSQLMAQYRALEAIKTRSLALEAEQAAGAEESTTVQTASLSQLMADYRAMEAIKSRSLSLEQAQAAAAEASAASQIASLGQLMAEYRAAEAIKTRSLALERAQSEAAEAASAVQTASLSQLMAEYRAAEAIKTNSIALEEAQAAAAEASAASQIASLGQLMAEYRAAETIKTNSIALEKAQAAAAQVAHAEEMASLRAMTAEYERAQAIKTRSIAMEKAQAAAVEASAAAQQRVVTATSGAAQRIAEYGANISRAEQLTRQYNTALERLRTDAAAAGLSEAAIAAEVAKLDAALAAGMNNIENYAGHARSGFSSILRELIVVAHEAFTGRFSRIPGSLMVLAEYATRTAAAFLPMAIAIGVVGFAVYEAIAAFEKFEVAVNRAMAGVKAQTGGGGFSKELFAGFINELDHMAGVSKTAAEEVVVSLSHIRTATPAVLQDAVRGMEGFIAVTGEKAPQAAQQLAEAMKNPVDAMQQWIDKGLAVDAQTLLNVNTLQQLGRMSEATALALKAYGDAGQKAADDLTPTQKAARDFENALLDLGHAFSLGNASGSLWASTLNFLSAVIGALTPIAQALGFVLREVFDALSFLLGGFTVIAAYIEGTFKAAMQQLIDDWKAVKAAARGDFSEAADLMSGKSKEMADIYVQQAKRIEDAHKGMIAALNDAGGGTGVGTPGTFRDAEKASQSSQDIENARRLIELGDKYASQKRDLVRITADMYTTDLGINRVSDLLATADGARAETLRKQLAILVEMRQSENAAYNSTLNREQPSPKGQASQIEEFKAELAEEKNASSEFHEWSNAQEADFWRNKLKLAKDGSKEIAEITKLMNDADRKAKEDSLRDTLDKMKNELSNANLSFAERSHILAQYTALANASYATGSTAFEAAKDFEVKTQARIEQEKLALVLKGIDEQNKADERRTAAFSRALDVQVKLGEISADQALQQKNAANDAMLASEVARIQREIAANVGGEKVKEGLQAQLLTVTDKYNNSILLSAEKVLEQEDSQYKQTFSRISSSISSSLMDVLKGTATWSQGMLKLAEGLTDDFVRQASQIATGWIRSEVIKTTETAAQTRARELLESVANSKSTAEIAEKVAAYRLSETTQTAATSSGVAARNTLGATENSGFFSRIGTAIAQWLGFETDKTAATSTGEAARETARVAAAAAALAPSVAFGMAQLEIEASVAAGAAFADSAALGPEGLAAAPEAATTAYGAVMGWGANMGGGVALATGAWEIPRTMQATLHQGETVVPASFASGLRSSGILGGATGGDTYHITVQALDTASGAQFIQQHARTIVTALRGQVRNGAPLAGML